MNLSKFYHNKVVLVTGASMGIGKELARQVLLNGGNVVITGRSNERLQSALSEFHIYDKNILKHQGDVVDYEDNLKLIRKIIERFGKLDVLINNAGISSYGELEETERKVVDEIIDINIKGSLFPSMAAISELKKAKGSLLFVSSIAGIRGLPGYSLYSMSKMTLTALAQSMRIENIAYGVFVGIAYVGFTENETEKMRFSPDGNLEQIPNRNKFLVKSREETAKKILCQIAEKKPSVIHSFFGKITYVLNKYLPFVVSVMLSKNYQKQRKNSNSK